MGARGSSLSRRCAAALMIAAGWLGGCRGAATRPPIDVGDLGAPTTWYLAPDGSDDNPGTRAAPFRTITHAATRMRPGDTALLRGGTYRGALEIRASGVEGAPLTFAAEGDDDRARPLLVAPPIAPGADVDTLRVLGSYITLDRLRVTDENDPGQAIWIAGSHVTVSRCEVFGARGQGILVSGDDDLIVASEVHHNGAHAAHDHGIYVEGARDTVRDSSVHDNWAHGIQLYAEHGEQPGAVVERNDVFHNGFGALAMGAWPTAGVVIAAHHPDAVVRDNRVCDNAQYGLYAIDGQRGTRLLDNTACCNRRGDVYLRVPGPDTVQIGARTCDGRDACAPRCRR